MIQEVSYTYCVYLITYKGEEIPPFYIGSTFFEKLKKGYRGSVASKKYSKIWKELNKKYPEKFVYQILDWSNDKIEILEKERYWQLLFDVVASQDFVNMSLANSKGCFGRAVCKDKHWAYGQTKHTNESIKNMSLKNSQKTKQNDEGKLQMSLKKSITQKGQTKENCERVKKQSETLKKLNKNNCEWRKRGGETNSKRRKGKNKHNDLGYKKVSETFSKIQKGQTKENCERVKKTAEKLNKLSIEQRKVLIDLIDKKIKFEDIIAFTKQRYNISIDDQYLRKMYFRETKKTALKKQCVYSLQQDIFDI